MGLGKTILRMFAPSLYAATTAPVASITLVKSDIKGALSSSGTQVMSGRITGYELNPDLAGQGKWAQTARQMLRTDSHLRALDRVTRHALKSLEWRTEAASDSPEAIRNADFINEAFGWGGVAGRMDEPWEAYVDVISHFTSVGFRTLEEVYKIEDGQVWLKRLSDMEPDSIDYWVPDTNTGELAYVRQSWLAMGEPQPRAVPAHKMLIFTLDKTGRNWEGIGLFRSAYIWHVFTKHLTNQSMIAVERWASPVPLVTVDRAAGKGVVSEGIPGEDIYTGPQMDQMIDDSKNMASGYRTGSVAFVMDNPVAKLGIFGQGIIAGVKELTEALRHADKEKSTLYLCGWLELGVENTGSRSVGEVHHAAFRAAVVNLGDIIKNALNGRNRPGGGTIERLLKINFYGAKPVPMSEMPQVVHSGLGADALSDALAQIPQLIGSGVLDATTALKQRVAALLDVPFDEAALAEQGVTREDLDGIKADLDSLVSSLGGEA